MKGHISIKNIISYVILVCFITNTTLSYAVSKEAQIAPAQKPSLLSEIKIPSSMGIISETYNAGSKGRIIIVQDRHAEELTQKNISGIIDKLIGDYGLNLICLEGASGALNAHFYDAYPDDEIKDRVARFLVKKAVFTGAEFYRIAHPGTKVKFTGAENNSTYLSHLAIFNKPHATLKDALDSIENIKSAIDKLKIHIYPRELIFLDKNIESYEVGDKDLSKFIKYLTELSEKQKIQINNYGELLKFEELIRKEKSIDFKKAETERNLIINKLSGILPKSELDSLLEKSVNFKLNKTTELEFYSYLTNLINENKEGLPMEKLNALKAYCDYLKASGEIDTFKLFRQVDELKTALESSLFKNEKQRTLAEIDKQVVILKGLIQLKLTPDNYLYYAKNKALFNIEGYKAFLSAYCPQYNIPFNIENNYISDVIKDAEYFYQLACLRDKYLAENALNYMLKNKAESAVLIAGGFHAKGIAEILKDKGISYTVILPRIGEDFSEGIYKSRMQNKPLSEEEIREILNFTIGQPLSMGGIMPEAERTAEDAWRGCHNLLKKNTPKEEKPDEEPSGAIGKWEILTKPVFDEQKGLVSFKARHIETGEQKNIKIKAGKATDEDLNMIKHKLLEVYDNTDNEILTRIINWILGDVEKETEDTEGEAKDNIIILKKNDYDISGIGRSYLIGVTENLMFNKQAWLHEIVEAALDAEIVTVDEIVDSLGSNSLEWLDKQLKKPGREKIKEHYIIRALLREQFYTANLFLTLHIRLSKWVNRLYRFIMPESLEKRITTTYKTNTFFRRTVLTAAVVIAVIGFSALMVWRFNENAKYEQEQAKARQGYVEKVKQEHITPKIFDSISFKSLDELLVWALPVPFEHIERNGNIYINDKGEWIFEVTGEGDENSANAAMVGARNNTQYVWHNHPLRSENGIGYIDEGMMQPSLGDLVVSLRNENVPGDVIFTPLNKAIILEKIKGDEANSYRLFREAFLVACDLADEYVEKDMKLKRNTFDCMLNKQVLSDELADHIFGLYNYNFIFPEGAEEEWPLRRWQVIVTLLGYDIYYASLDYEGKEPLIQRQEEKRLQENKYLMQALADTSALQARLEDLKKMPLPDFLDKYRKIEERKRSDSRGIEGLPNDVCTEELREAIRRKNILTVSYDGTVAAKDIFYNDETGEDITTENQRYSKNDLAALNVAILELSKEDRELLKDLKIVFFKGKRQAHYAILRNQVYINIKHINSPSELTKILHHEIQERNYAITQMDKLAEQGSSYMHWQYRRDEQHIKRKIEELATQRHIQLNSEEKRLEERLKHIKILKERFGAQRILKPVWNMMARYMPISLIRPLLRLNVFFLDILFFIRGEGQFDKARILAYWMFEKRINKILAQRNDHDRDWYINLHIPELYIMLGEIAAEEGNIDKLKSHLTVVKDCISADSTGSYRDWHNEQADRWMRIIEEKVDFINAIEELINKYPEKLKMRGYDAFSLPVLFFEGMVAEQDGEKFIKGIMKIGGRIIPTENLFSVSWLKSGIVAPFVYEFDEETGKGRIKPRYPMPKDFPKDPGNLMGKLFDKDGKLITEGITAKEENGFLVFYRGEDILYAKDGEPAKVKLTGKVITTSSGQEIKLIEDNENIRGFADASGVLYLVPSLANNPIALYHERGEAHYAQENPTPTDEFPELPEGVNAHTFLRGCGKEVRDLVVGAASGGEYSRSGDRSYDTAEDIIAYLKQHLSTDRLNEAEIALIRHNESQGKKGIDLLYGLQDFEFGADKNEEFSQQLSEVSVKAKPPPLIPAPEKRMSIRETICWQRLLLLLSMTDMPGLKSYIQAFLNNIGVLKQKDESFKIVELREESQDKVFRVTLETESGAIVNIYVKGLEKRKQRETMANRKTTVVDSRLGVEIGPELIQLLKIGGYKVQKITVDGKLHGTLTENAGTTLLNLGASADENANKRAKYPFNIIKNLLDNDQIPVETKEALRKLAGKMSYHLGIVLASHYVMGYADGNGGNICLKLKSGSQEVSFTDIKKAADERNDEYISNIEVSATTIDFDQFLFEQFTGKEKVGGKGEILQDEKLMDSMRKTAYEDMSRQFFDIFEDPSYKEEFRKGFVDFFTRPDKPTQSEIEALFRNYKDYFVDYNEANDNSATMAKAVAAISVKMNIDEEKINRIFSRITVKDEDGFVDLGAHLFSGKATDSRGAESPPNSLEKSTSQIPKPPIEPPSTTQTKSFPRPEDNLSLSDTSPSPLLKQIMAVAEKTGPSPLANLRPELPMEEIMKLKDYMDSIKPPIRCKGRSLLLYTLLKRFYPDVEFWGYWKLPTKKLDYAHYFVKIRNVIIDIYTEGAELAMQQKFPEDIYYKDRVVVLNEASARLKNLGYATDKAERIDISQFVLEQQKYIDSLFEILPKTEEFIEFYNLLKAEKTSDSSKPQGNLIMGKPHDEVAARGEPFQVEISTDSTFRAESMFIGGTELTPGDIETLRADVIKTYEASGGQYQRFKVTSGNIEKVFLKTQITFNGKTPIDIFIDEGILNGLKLTSVTDLKVWINEAISKSIKIRGPNAFDNIKGPLVLALLDKSANLFEDHRQNNFIGINKALFTFSENSRRIAFQIGISHELRHEAGEHDEEKLVGEDVELAFDESFAQGAKELADDLSNSSHIAKSLFTDKLKERLNEQLIIEAIRSLSSLTPRTDLRRREIWRMLNYDSQKLIDIFSRAAKNQPKPVADNIKQQLYSFLLYTFLVKDTEYIHLSTVDAVIPIIAIRRLLEAKMRVEGSGIYGFKINPNTGTGCLIEEGTDLRDPMLGVVRSTADRRGEEISVPVIVKFKYEELKKRGILLNVESLGARWQSANKEGIRFKDTSAIPLDCFEIYVPQFALESGEYGTLFGYLVERELVKLDENMRVVYEKSNGFSRPKIKYDDKTLVLQKDASGNPTGWVKIEPSNIKSLPSLAKFNKIINEIMGTETDEGLPSKISRIITPIISAKLKELGYDVEVVSVGSTSRGTFDTSNPDFDFGVVIKNNNLTPQQITDLQKLISSDGKLSDELTKEISDQLQTELASIYLRYGNAIGFEVRKGRAIYLSAGNIIKQKLLQEIKFVLTENSLYGPRKRIVGGIDITMFYSEEDIAYPAYYQQQLEEITKNLTPEEKKKIEDNIESEIRRLKRLFKELNIYKTDEEKAGRFTGVIVEQFLLNLSPRNLLTAENVLEEIYSIYNTALKQIGSSGAVMNNRVMEIVKEQLIKRMPHKDIAARLAGVSPENIAVLIEMAKTVAGVKVEQKKARAIEVLTRYLTEKADELTDKDKILIYALYLYINKSDKASIHSMLTEQTGVPEINADILYVCLREQMTVEQIKLMLKGLLEKSGVLINYLDNYEKITKLLNEFAKYAGLFRMPASGVKDLESRKQLIQRANNPDENISSEAVEEILKDILAETSDKPGNDEFLKSYIGYYVQGLSRNSLNLLIQKLSKLNTPEAKEALQIITQAKVFVQKVGFTLHEREFYSEEESENVNSILDAIGIERSPDSVLLNLGSGANPLIKDRFVEEVVNVDEAPPLEYAEDRNYMGENFLADDFMEKLRQRIGDKKINAVILYNMWTYFSLYVPIDFVQLPVEERIKYFLNTIWNKYVEEGSYMIFVNYMPPEYLGKPPSKGGKEINIFEATMREVMQQNEISEIHRIIDKKTGAPVAVVYRKAIKEKEIVFIPQPEQKQLTPSEFIDGITKIGDKHYQPDLSGFISGPEDKSLEYIVIITEDMLGNPVFTDRDQLAEISKGPKVKFLIDIDLSNYYTRKELEEKGEKTALVEFLSKWGLHNLQCETVDDFMKQNDVGRRQLGEVGVTIPDGRIAKFMEIAKWRSGNIYRQGIKIGIATTEKDLEAIKESDLKDVYVCAQPDFVFDVSGEKLNVLFLDNILSEMYKGMNGKRDVVVTDNGLFVILLDLPKLKTNLVQELLEFIEKYRPAALEMAQAA